MSLRPLHHAIVTAAALLCCVACADDPAARSDLGGPPPADAWPGADHALMGDALPPRSDLKGRDAHPAQARCVSQADVDALLRPFSCQGKAKIKATNAQLPHDCHSQGVGWHVGSQSFVVTCMDQGSGQSGRVLAYPAAANDSGQWLASDAAEVFVAADTSHPSAIQIGLQVFPVAMAKSSSAGPTTIRFFKVSAGAAGAPKIDGPLGAGLTHTQSHVGALAYATLGGVTQMIGCGWDCATISFWSAPGAEQTAGFKLVRHAATSSLVKPGVDTKVGKYNSLYLVDRCEQGRRPLLFASHEDWLDIWELSNLGTPAVSMSKIAKRKITESVVKWKGGRPIFYEGMTLEIIPGQGVRYWANPHDYGTSSCPAGTRCMQYVYRCRFGP